MHIAIYLQLISLTLYFIAILFNNFYNKRLFTYKNYKATIIAFAFWILSQIMALITLNYIFDLSSIWPFIIWSCFILTSCIFGTMIFKKYKLLKTFKSEFPQNFS